MRDRELRTTEGPEGAICLIRRKKKGFRDTEDGLVATLQAHEPELRAAGISALSLFGSAARGDNCAGSDVDVAAELDPDAHLGLRFFAIERRLAELLERPVDLLAEPVENPRLRANLQRDRRRVF